MNCAEHKPTLRTISVLEQISAGNNKYTLSELSRTLNIPPSTLLPIVRTLREHQYLNFDEVSQTYSIGIRLFEIATRLQETDYYAQLTEIMQTIVDGCSETCHFGILSGGDVLYMAKVDSPQPIRMFSMTGRRLPAYGTGVGKALLRDYTLEQLQTLYPKGLIPLTPKTVTDFDAFYTELQDIKKNTFAYENEESNENIRCIAIPLSCNGVVTAALSVANPVFRYSEEKREIIEHLLKDASVFAEKILPYLNI